MEGAIATEESHPSDSKSKRDSSDSQNGYFRPQNDAKPEIAGPSPLAGADLRTDDTNVSELVRIANRWSRLSRVGLKAELCERGANPRQREEFQVEPYGET